VLARTLTVALRSGGDFAEVFAEDRASTNVTFDDGRVEDLVSGRQRGAGVRVVRGESTGYAHTADLTEAGLRDAASAAAAAARGSADHTRVVSLERHAVDTPTIAQPPDTIAKQTKVAVLERADAAARGRGSAVQQVGASYADGRRRILVANSDGLLVEDEQTRTRLSVSCVAVGDRGAGAHRRVRALRRGVARGRGDHGRRPRAHDARCPSRALGPDARRAAPRRGRCAVP